ncbi:uncharacterized protein LOC117646410 isoform X2 [Thrips palmi]|uniref:Uncharacterized protein LOC117646410 isoform X2 n=1 Tax=Thrips palmi TaxID=161013 RepID=A0A6P8YZU7_THRPL|nr:uncharacterized protein LOC117646410 isoform X2 [Thrips palmi]XP_034243201.1 uncharacterized protein LOC117646410 isoform X2 [Thrips palmi]XP_034243202.1 uncharacterized protein LOC117646410 isoform X2 [Thrips palmi]XP_034243204.1 uncharacterized protein LOC117646410 isoform X2 [Thrips palmi]XP_034243205.1 uncharacterized protein LOC117646410 isoform X2 [Thrips palmi]
MENSNSAGGRRRGTTKHSAEDQALDQIAKEAEARLAARRQARAEAREIRMRELERQQKESEENADRLYDMHPETALRTPPARSVSQSRTPVVNNSGGGSSGGSGGANNHQWSRRSSEDSLEDGGGPSPGPNGETPRDGRSTRDLRHELKEVEDKFRKAMIQNAQLDNEKASYTYQVELLKDKLEDLEVAYAQLQRENKEKCREVDQLKRLTQRLKDDLVMCQAALEERDRLIQEQGLVIVGDEGELDGCEDGEKRTPRKALVSVESAEMLQKAGEGSLDVRLRKLAEERNELLDQIRHFKLELEDERSRHRNGPRTLNGPQDSDMEDLQRESQKLLGDYKFKLQKAEQDVSTLQANVARLESQVIRYKSAAETAEKVEDELKVEKRKLQREVINGLGDESTLAVSDIAFEETGSLKESGHLEEVKEADELSERIEDSSNEGGDEQDFWAVIFDGTSDETCQNPSSNESNGADVCDPKSYPKSSVNNSQFTKICEDDSDDESFEAISAIAFLLGDEANYAVDSNAVDKNFVKENCTVCVAVEDEAEDFWAKLQEEDDEASDFQNQKSDRDEFSDPNSWSILGSSDLPGADQCPNHCQSEGARNENDVESDMFDYLEGVTIWDEDGADENSNVANGFYNDELDYLVGVTIWAEAPADLLYEQQAAIEDPTGILDEGKVHPSEYYWSYNIHNFDPQDLLGGKEPEVHFVSQESKRSFEVSLDNDGLEAVDMDTKSPFPSLDKEKSAAKHLFAIPESPQEVEGALNLKSPAAKNGSSQRFPKHSMIPKPKKQNQQCHKSDADANANADDSPAPNVTSATLDRPGSRRSRDRDRDREKDRDRRRRGRGSGSRWHMQRN